MRASVTAAWPAMCSRFEGRCWWMYLDTKYLVTTGLGILLETVAEAQAMPWFRNADGVDATDAEIATEYARVKARRDLAKFSGFAYKPSAVLRLPEAEIDRQLLATTAQFWAVLKREHPALDEWPADAQLAALDLIWQNGPAFTRAGGNWPNMRAAFNDQDWPRAAESVPGTHLRAQTRKRLFGNAAKVAELMLDPEFLWDTKTPVPPSNVGHWLVDPDKVTTRLRGRDKDGNIVAPLDPGTIITNGVRFEFNWVGKIALWTAGGVAYEREYLTQVEAGPVPVPVTLDRPVPVIPDYAGTEKLSFRGGRTCICVATSLPWVEYRMLEIGIIRFNIDIYQLGYRDDVEASKGTHARGGNTDVGQYSEAALKVWRDMGWAMQDRSPFFAADHAHGWPVGCPHLSEAAKKQVTAWVNGRNGLVNNGRITGPNPKGSLTRRWDEALADYKDLLDLEEA